MPLRSSRAIPRPVHSALATILLEMQWFTSLANLDSFRRRILSRRLAALVPFFWSFLRSHRHRWRSELTLAPE